MKKIFCFSFVLFLFSSLFILNGCYTTFRVQERESTYESVVSDSNKIIIQNNYFYDNLWMRSGLYLGYRYPYWYSDAYWYNPWHNLWYGFYWNGYKFGYWDYWYNRPYVNWSDRWNIYRPPHVNNEDIRFRIRGNDGERRVRPPNTQRPEDRNSHRDKTRRVRDERPLERQSPPVTEPRRGTNVERRREQPVISPRNTDTSRGKSSQEKTEKREQTSDRKRK